MTSHWQVAILGAALFCATPAASEELVLDPPSGHVVVATVKGVLLRLRVTLDAHGFIVLNQAAARRARLGRGDGASTMSIGPVRLKGREAKRTVTIGGATALLTVRWYEAAVSDDVDGVISPALLPYDRVRLRFAPAVPGERATTFRVQLSDGDGLHVPVGVGGAYSIATRFSTTNPHTVAAGAAGAMMAETRGGTLAPEYARVEIGFGIHRPARWLTLSKPVAVGGRMIQRVLMRTGDFLGQHSLPPDDTRPPDGEIIVTAPGERQRAIYRMTLGRDVLGTCSEAEYQKAASIVVLRCGW